MTCMKPSSNQSVCGWPKRPADLTDSSMNLNIKIKMLIEFEGTSKNRSLVTINMVQK